MLEELFDAIGQQAVKARGVRIHTIPNGPAHRFWVESPDGDLTPCEVDPSPRNHKAYNLATLAQVAIAHASRKDEQRLIRFDDQPPQLQTWPLPTPRVVVWYSRQGVVALLDDDTRRDRVLVDFSLSKPLQVLHNLAAMPAAKSQADFVQMLRTVFADCMGECPDLLLAARQIRFKQHSEGGATVQLGKSSIGRQAMAELAGVEKPIPEAVVLTVPVFGSLFDFEADIRCTVDADPQEATFRLTPLPGECEKALAAAEQAVGQQLHLLLDEAKIPVLCGVP